MRTQIKEIVMPAKPSGKIKTSRVNVKQKNGDIYVMERQTLYDPVKKYNKVVSSKLIAKIPKGEKIQVPTRPKRPNGSKLPIKPQKVSASRKRRRHGLARSSSAAV